MANKVPAGSRIRYEDDVVAVYDERGALVEKGLLDYSLYKEGFNKEARWDEAAGNYLLPSSGYRIVGLG